MAERIENNFTNPRKELFDRRNDFKLQAETNGPREGGDERFGFDPSIGDGGTNEKVSLAGIAREQNAKSRQQEHEDRGVFGLTESSQLTDELIGKEKGFNGAARRRTQGSRAICREIQ